MAAKTKIGAGALLGLAAAGFVAFKVLGKSSSSKSTPYKGFMIKTQPSGDGYRYTISGRGLSIRSDIVFTKAIDAMRAAAVFIDSRTPQTTPSRAG